MRMFINEDYLTALSVTGIFEVPGMADSGTSLDDAIVESARAFFESNHAANMPEIRKTVAFAILAGLYTKYSSSDAGKSNTRDVEVYPLVDEFKQAFADNNLGEVPVIVVEFSASDIENVGTDDYLVSVFFRNNDLVVYAANMKTLINHQGVNVPSIAERVSEIDDDSKLYVMLVSHDVKHRHYNAFFDATVIEVPTVALLDNPNQLSYEEEIEVAYDRMQALKHATEEE